MKYTAVLLDTCDLSTSGILENNKNTMTGRCINLDDYMKEINKIKTDIVVIKTYTEQNKHMMEKIFAKLFGNGQEGLITTITRHKVYFALLGSALVMIIGCLIKILI